MRARLARWPTASPSPGPKAAPDPHRADGAERLNERMLEAFRGRAAGARRAAA